MNGLREHITAGRESGALLLRWLAGALVALELLALFLLLPGCGGSEQVVVPAQETAENWQADTLQLPAPPELKPAGAGRVALPARVERHAPLLGAAPFSVTEIELGGDTLTVRSPTVTRRFRAPAAGETLRVRREERTGASADASPGAPPEDAGGAVSDTVGGEKPTETPRVVGRVDGRPAADTISTSPAEEEEKEKSALGKVLGLPGWALAALIVVLATAAIFFFRMFR